MSAGMTYVLFVGLPVIVLFFGVFADNDSVAFRWARLQAWAGRVITRTGPLLSGQAGPWHDRAACRRVRGRVSPRRRAAAPDGPVRGRRAGRGAGRDSG
jgi:hypothetical protein